MNVILLFVFVVSIVVITKRYGGPFGQPEGSPLVLHTT